jgi:hypothetical protein
MEGWIYGECHIECYCPVFPSPIVCKSKKLPSKALKKIHNWNRQFELPKPKKKYLRPSQNVNIEVGSLQKRKWLEVLKFLDIRDLMTVSLVSKEFYAYTWSIEIWRIHVGSASDNPYKLREIFVTRKIRSCISCGDNNEKKLKKCPILQRPICKYCRSNPYSRQGNMRYYLWPLVHLIMKHGINRSVLDRHNVAILYDEDLVPRTYEFLVLEALNKDSQENPEHIMVTRSKRRRESAA